MICPTQSARVPGMRSHWWNSAEPVKRGQKALFMHQLVAYNVREGRRLRDLSQSQLADRLEKISGKAWAKTSVSAAESGWSGSPGRARRFDTSDLLLFSLALRLPIVWFLLPPTTRPDGDALDPDAPVISVNHTWDATDMAISPNLLTWLATAVDDPDDEEDLLGDRLEREGW